MPDLSSTAEARLFAKYLVKKPATEQVVNLYEEAIQPNGKMNKTDAALFRFVTSQSYLLGFIDAGLVFHSPHSELRRRIYIMLAILEASPDYHDDFLPKERGKFYVLFVAYSGARAVFKAIVGTALIKVISR